MLYLKIQIFANFHYIAMEITRNFPYKWYNGEQTFYWKLFQLLSSLDTFFQQCYKNMVNGRPQFVIKYY